MYMLALEKFRSYLAESATKKII